MTVEQQCGNCRHWKLWPPNDELESVMVCLAPLPTWVMGTNGNQETRHDQGTNCDVWEQRGHR